MKLRKRTRSFTTMPEVNVIPLIDVSLMLLVVFMVTTPMLQHGIKINLPQGQSQELKDAKQELVVFIDKHEKIFLNDVEISQDALLSTLQKKVQVGRNKRAVFVKGDRAVPYGKVIECVDRIKSVEGVEYVGLATHRMA